jgi:hypothetical protein
MSAPMVQALRAGRKTKTRRIVKPSPDWDQPMPCPSVTSEGWQGPLDYSVWAHEGDLADGCVRRCPYGKPGGLLWVRETWAQPFRRNPGTTAASGGCVYRADDNGRDLNPGAMDGKWRPSIHMPRWASRLTLRVTDVRVERLQDISEADAIAEGIERIDDPRGTAWKSYEIIHEGRHRGKPHPHALAPNRSPITSYRELWESINGGDSWALNPWVWALTFTVKQRNVDDVLKAAA